jgi:membrane-bound ClpP family serine protease
MPFQLNTLAGVDPTSAYALFLAGGVLVIFECLRPGTVFAGIGGAVLITISLDALAKWPWTWYGIVLLGLAACFAFLGVRAASAVPRILSALAFGAGSIWLVPPPTGVHPAAAGAGILLAFICNWLLWIGGRARLAKRSECNFI